jgi:outer membrane protein
MITDFGHTSSLIASARLAERAEQANEMATRQDVALIPDRAFFSALQARAMLGVAQQNIATRKATQAQISELTRNNHRSTLDLDLASGNVLQGQMELLGETLKNLGVKLLWTMALEVPHNGPVFH